MKYYLISIGGTGAKCLEAFVHMNAAGFMQHQEEIKIIYVDPDASNGNLGKAKETVISYANAFSNVAQEIDFFKNKLSAEDVVWNPVPNGSNNNLYGIFNRSGMDIESENLECLFDILFSEEEQKTRLTEGFRAHPSIGAAVIGDKMSMSDEKSVWKKMADEIASGEGEARIFFFGSVFGGTGAAGFPNIPRIMRRFFDEKAVDNPQPNQVLPKNTKVKIGGCLMLPYFQFAPSKEKEMLGDENGAIEKIAPDSAKFNASTYAALNYYKQSSLLCKDPDRRNVVGAIDDIEPAFDAVYLLGDKKEFSVGAYHAGQKEQQNKAHYLEMLAALSAFDFFNKPSEDDFFKESKCYMLALEGERLSFKDLPAPYAGCNVEAKLKTFIRTAYMYRSMVYPKLKECYEDKTEELFKENPWIDYYLFEYREVRSLKTFMMKKEMPVAFITDDDFKVLTAFRDYCVRYMNWLKDFTCSDVPGELRGEKLVNKDIFNYDDNKSYLDNLNDSDVLRVVKPECVFDDNANTNFDEKESNFLQQLINNDDADTRKKSVANLLAMVYDVCKDGKEVK